MSPDRTLRSRSERPRRHAVRRWLLLGALAAPLPASLPAQERVDTILNRRIRQEGMERSQVLATALGLSDLNGPRLAGSPGFLRAARWARDRLASWGLAGAALEPWGIHAPSWVLDRYAIEMTAPVYLRIEAFPMAWSGATRATVVGTPVLAPILADSDFAKWHGKLKDRIVLDGTIQPIRNRERTPFRRLSDAALDSMARLTDPGEPRSFWKEYDDWAQELARYEQVMAFFRDEGAAAVLRPSGNDEVLSPQGWWSYAKLVPGTVPSFVISRDQFNRLARMIASPVPPRLALSLRAHLVTADTVGYNVVAELPGTDQNLAPELIMLGAHLDSWMGGTGATDNAAGCAVVMEALRILKAVKARPRRTIRVALWDGEENSGDDYGGSLAYVRRHFASPETMQPLPEYDRFSAYLNVDNGTGRIRGIYLQGDSAARPIFQALLDPFADLGAAHTTILNTASTDHMSFIGVGLPGFQFIQDPVDYDARTHHTVLDVGDYLLEDDLKQAAVVVASVAYHLAMRDGLVPRPPRPEPRPRP
jgi:carboxypeptidase Q